MKGILTLTEKESTKLQVLNLVLQGQTTAIEAAILLRLSERHTRRLLAAYREEGAMALAHGNRGRLPANTIHQEVRQQVITLAKSTYAGINHQHLSELLAEREGIVLSRPSLRRILLDAGLPSHRRRRPPQHRRRRQRYAREGMLLQIDGSKHRWLGEDLPWLTLLAAIDDATSNVVGGLFREEEDAQGYFLLLQDIVAHYGRPLAVYHDSHGIFERNDKEPWTLAEQLAGGREPTQCGRLLQELSIVSIRAHSPQAKGRVERLFGTLQERLGAEMRLAGIKSLPQANRFLPGFLLRYNHQFAVEPEEPGVAYRALPAGWEAKEIFCFKHERVVAADNTVRFGGLRLQIGFDKQRRSYAHAKVEVHERMDGSVAVYYEGRCLTTTEAPVETPTLRVGQRRAAQVRPLGLAEGAAEQAAASNAQQTSLPKSSQPGPNHPWRTPFHRPRMTESLNR